VTRVSDHLRRNAYGLVAVFIALGGTTYAANKVGSADIERNAVKSKHIGAGQVKSADVGDGQVGTADLAEEAVTGATLDEETLGPVPSAGTATEAELLDGIDSSGFLRSGPNAVAGREVRDNSLTGADVNEGSLSGVLGCEPGMHRAGDICVENVERSPLTDWQSAVRNCAADGRRLPDPSEALMVVEDLASRTSSEAATWTSDTWGDSANPNAYTAFKNDIPVLGLSHAPIGNSARYVCVTELTD
jgi:hypothetical protein